MGVVTHDRSNTVEMGDITQEPNSDITPSSSEDDLLPEKSEDSLDDFDDDDNNENDIDKMLSELQNFQEELEQTSQSTANDGGNPATTLEYLPPSHPLDEFRFSLSAIEGSGEVDLDALLEDLCIMERDINPGFEMEDTFADTLSSPQQNSPISPTAKISADVRSRLESVQEETRQLTPEEQQERIKAEKIRIALEKLRAARVKKLVIKVYNDEDPTSKTIAIDQTWTAWEVCKKMMRKNDTEPDPNWVLVERIPQLNLERLLEDHESVVDVVSSWPWDSENKLVINNRREKYALFRNPQNFLLTNDTSSGAAQLAEKSKDILLQEFFQKDAMRLPDLDGVLYLKEGKKSWKKHYFALRASGIYYTPKGKAKSSKDIVCLMKFENVSIYNGIGFKKKLKAPTEHCFVLKHPQCQDFESKAVRCFCAEDLRTLHRWVVAIRLAKFGYKMLVDYSETQDEMDKLAFTLERNKFTRASSFTAGQSTDTANRLQTEVKEVKDYHSVKAKLQSERIKDSIGSSSIHPRGSLSFSINRSRLEARKPSKKIGNLFSDAWKKGNEAESPTHGREPVSPDTPSVSSAGSATPNTLNPKPFSIENIGLQPLEEIKEDTRVSERVELVPEHNLQLDPPPLPRKSFSSKPQIDEEEKENQGDVSAGREEEQSEELSRKHRSSSRRSRKNRSVSPPPPPPPPPSEIQQDASDAPDSTAGTHDSTSMTFSSSPQANGSGSPPPPPLPAKSPTRTALSSQEEDVFSHLPPPPYRECLSSSGDFLPPPPPCHDLRDDVDVDLPPPPPEVLFKEKLSESLSNGRRRTTSGGNEPPAVPPKTCTGRQRLNSSGKPVPPAPPRTSSFSGSP